MFVAGRNGYLTQQSYEASNPLPPAAPPLADFPDSTPDIRNIASSANPNTFVYYFLNNFDKYNKLFLVL